MMGACEGWPATINRLKYRLLKKSGNELTLSLPAGLACNTFSKAPCPQNGAYIRATTARKEQIEIATGNSLRGRCPHKKSNTPGNSSMLLTLMQQASANTSATTRYAILPGSFSRTNSQSDSSTKNSTVTSTCAFTHASKSNRGFQANVSVASKRRRRFSKRNPPSERCK